MSLPKSVEINAWTGAEVAHGEMEPDAANWGAGRGLPHAQEALEFGPPADPTRWQDSKVGYGVLLPDRDDPTLSNAAKAAGHDAPEPVRELLRKRPGTVVLRWRPELDSMFLRRYYPDGKADDPTIGLSEFGVGKGQLPRYVVIIGKPDVIPWSVQYALGTRHAVGRLPLSGEALGHYIDALLSQWSDAPADTSRALVWTVDHGGSDITGEMRAVIARPLAKALAPPPLAGLCDVADARSTGDALVTGLVANPPGLVVTSSHGQTAPLDRPEEMRSSLGLPVDSRHAPLPLRELVDAMPGGSVWYAQACCSAGGGGESHYTGLLTPGTTAYGTVSAVAGLGPLAAPAAVELLGRVDPVRAVFGHVEPTFSWTLRVKETGQGLGRNIVAALTSHLYAGQPLGLVFDDYYAGVGALHSQWFALDRRLNGGDGSVLEAMTRLRLTALDRQSLVLLGDPTVALPALV